MLRFTKNTFPDPLLHFVYKPAISKRNGICMGRVLRHFVHDISIVCDLQPDIFFGKIFSNRLQVWLLQRSCVEPMVMGMTFGDGIE